MSLEKTVIAGGHIITMDPEFGDLPEGAVLVEGDRIIAIARSADEFAGVDARVVDARGGYILPGMIDSHRHTWMALLRGISADQSLMQFLATTFYGIGSVVQPEDAAAASTVGALEALDAGVTTIFDCHDCVNSPDHARADVEALRATGIRSVYAYGMQQYDYRPPAFDGHAARLADASALRGSHFASDDDMSRMAMLYSDFGTVSFEETAAEIRRVRELGIVGASHTGAATSSILLRGLRELDDRELLLPGHLHIHCPALNHQEWQLIADTGGKVTIAPETEMQMGMGHPPFRAALDHGLAPGISTDIVCVGSGDLFSQMRLGLQFQRCLDHDRVHATGTMPTTVDLGVRDALTWATHNSAAAIGLADEIGSLTVGKKADVIVVRPRMDLVRSSYPAGSVVLQSTAADVDTVMVNGVIRKQDGVLVGVDRNTVRTEANAALDRLEKAAAMLPKYSDAEIYGWFSQAERTASANFAQAYTTA
ncbi:amidohydrolase family protein [Nocardia nova SH22a]|uniref:Amidohydrolase family protein n=1 Tax=Nocardia nova SH22a TaxID=1415166 RepID=W5TNZ4_9NOCA|nr:amidohydrolase family protein [Nocardia nova]AHH20972.1 amidohydrolase family protein [Nocardia nova SH22a]